MDFIDNYKETIEIITNKFQLSKDLDEKTIINTIASFVLSGYEVHFDKVTFLLTIKKEI